MKYGLKDYQIESLQDVFAEFSQIDQAIIYGSRAKGNYKPASDIDLTLRGINFEPLLLSKLEEKIDDLLLPYTIDLSIFSQISNPDLIDHIERVGQIFYERRV